MLHVLVLGAAAGGGVPQWNCNCQNCAAARSGEGDVSPATQSSLAVSADRQHWFLINASPDLRQQVEACPALHPRRALRHSPVSGVVLTNGDVDAVVGLLHMREGAAFTIWAHTNVLDVLAANSIFDVLPQTRVPRRAIMPDTPFALTLPDGQPSGLTVEAFTVPGKVPLYAEEDGGTPAIGIEVGDTLGLEIRDDGTGRSLFYVAACTAITPALADRLRGADLVFFDGTLWDDDEMIRAGLSQKTGQRMGHISMNGDVGSIAGFRSLEVRRKIFTHINNSNPVLRGGTPERRAAEAAGWVIAHDGLEIEL